MMSKKVHCEKPIICKFCGKEIGPDEKTYECFQPDMKGYYHFGNEEDDKNCFQKACKKNAVIGAQQAASGRAIASGSQPFVAFVQDANPYAFHRR